MQPIPVLAPVLLASLVSVSAQAAVTVDVDLAALRADPATAPVRERIAAALPAEAGARLAAIEAATGWDPRRDLTRIVVTIPDDGVPTLRLVGIPAERIAGLLARRGGGLATASGAIAHPLPQGRGALIALGADQAVIVPVARAGAYTGVGALPPTAGAPVRGVLTPGPTPRAAFMTLVSTVVFTADGSGHLNASVTAKDETAAGELERRFGVLKQMVQVGADGGLPEVARAQGLLAGATCARSGAQLELAAIVPESERGALLLRGIERMKERRGIAR
jgi:hypothetical protein